MTERIRAFDWSATPLGPIDRWPQNLKTVVDLMLVSPSMMSLVWGAEAIHLYNDSFAELLREHRTTSLGQSAFTTFARSHDVFAADVASGMAGRSARLSAQRYPVLRDGELGDAWFDVDYAPVRDETGAVAGVLWTLQETTAQIAAERALRESEARVRLLFDAIDDGFCTFEMIFDEAGTPVDFRYIEVNAGFANQTGQRPSRGQTMRETFPQAEHMWLDLYAEVSRTGEARRFVDYVGGLDRWYDVYVFPVHLDGDRVLGALFRDVTDSKRAEVALRNSEERHAFLVRFSDAVRGQSDPVAVATTACSMLLDVIDVDRAHWSEVDWTTQEFVSVGSAASPGVRPIEGRFPLSAWEPYSASLRAGRSVVIDDTQIDPRADGAMREGAANLGIGADLAAPVLVDGRLASCLAVKRSHPHRWTSREIALVEGIADRCWAEVERARAEAALHENEKRQAFLLNLSDALRPLSDAAEIQATTARLLGEHIGVDRAMYAEVCGEHGFERGTIRGQYVRPPATPFPEQFTFDQFGAHTMAARYRGEPLVVGDVETDPAFSADERAAWSRAGVRAAIVATLAKDGRLVAEFGLHATTARIWTETDVALVQDVAERTWAAAQRARAEGALRASEQALAADLASAEILRGLSERLVAEDSLQSIYEDVLSAAIAITGADAGTVQIYDPATRSLELIASRNFSRTITDYFDRVEAGSRTACGIALKSGAYAFADLPEEVAGLECQLLAGEGMRSAVAYPLVSRTGSPLGMLNAHWREARHRLNDRELRFLGLLARQAADLIEQRRSQGALRDSEQQKRLMVELVPALLWSASADGQVISLNERWPAYTGQTEAETQDHGWLDAIHPDDLPETRAAFGHAFATGAPIERQHRIHKAGDGWRWHLVRQVPVRDEHGTITGWFGAAVDIHESKLAEQALQKTERRLQSLVEGVPQLVWRAVNGGHWTWASPQWTEFTGQAEADSHGFGWLDPVHPDDREHVMGVWRGANERGEFHADYRICHQGEDRYRWFQTRATPVRDGDGDIIEWIGTSTDVDDLRGLQERQQVLVAELQHRTRNLMGVVRSTADRTGETSRDFDDFRARFRDRLDALARVQSLLSRLNESDRIAFDELIQTEIAAMHGSGDRVSLDGPPGVRLRSSMVQTLAMAIHELATNAVKYGALGQPDGHLAVSWRMLEPDRRGRPRLHIDWRESGVKMPSRRAPRGGGQGRELIERALPYQLGAETSFELGPDGVRCTITIPISASTARKDANG